MPVDLREHGINIFDQQIGDRRPEGPGAVSNDDRPILLIHLNNPERLSLGELGQFLMSVQRDVRFTGRVLGAIPARKSVRLARVEQGSLEFLVEVVGWGETVAKSCGPTFVEFFRLTVRERGFAVALVALVCQLLRSRKDAKRERRLDTQEQEEAVDRELAAERRQNRATRKEAQQLAKENELPFPIDDIETGVRLSKGFSEIAETVRRANGGFVQAMPNGPRVAVAMPNGPRVAVDEEQHLGLAKKSEPKKPDTLPEMRSF